MSNSVSKITIIEDFRDEGGHGSMTQSTPNFHQPLFPSVAEFVFKASKMLSDFRAQWVRDHADDPFAKGLEMDVVPVMTDGMIMGYMALSEIDGATYDYLPAEYGEEEESK